ncbi:hypothetical protein GCM10027579_12780 [Calidifontibacter terrae]
MVSAFGRNLRSLYTAGSLIVVLSVAVQLGNGVGSPGTAIWCVSLSALSVVAVWRDGFGPGLSTVAIVATAVTTAVVPVKDPALLNSLPLWCSLVVLGLPRIAGLAWFLAADVLFVGITLVRSPGGDPLSSIVDSFARTATVVAVVLVVRSGLRAAQTWEEQAQRSRARVRADAELLATEIHSRWVDHFLHDRVVHALKAVTLAEQLSRREIVAAAQETVRAMDVLAGTELGSPFSTRLRDVGAAIDLRIRWRTEDVALPEDVATALIEAAREALRNVRQHADTDHAEVELRRWGKGVRLTVRDRGRGFDPTVVPRGHFGLNQGMHQRLAAVGGEVSVSSDSRGTAVVLTWGDRAGSRDWTDAFGFRALTIEAGAPFVLLNVVQAIAMAGHVQHPQVALGATGIVTVAWIVAATVLRRRAATTLEATALIATALAATASGLFSVSPQSGPTTYWLAGGTTPLLLFAIASLPVIRTLPWAVLLACLPTIGLVSRGIDGSQLRDFAPALVSPVGGILLAYVALFAVQRVVQDASARAQADDLSIERTIRAGARQVVLGNRLSDLRDRIQPFLVDIATTRMDPTDPQVQRVARVYEARVRDVLGGAEAQWPTELRAAVDALRERGASVTLANHVPPEPAQIGSVRRVLRTLEAVDIAGACIRVTTTPRPVGSLAAVTVTPYLPLLRERLADLASPAQLRTDHSSYLIVRHPYGDTSPEKAGHARVAALAESGS